MKLEASDVAELVSLGFSTDWPGYTPEVVESPGGNSEWDTEKRYFHISPKYLDKYQNTLGSRLNVLPEGKGFEIEEIVDRRSTFFRKIHEEAWKHSRDVALQLGYPSEFWPAKDRGALRVLEYPPRVGGAKHTDPNLFTLSLYRNDTSLFWHGPRETKGMKERAEELSPGIHFGEMTEMLFPWVTADQHGVHECGHSQFSVVYFAIPKWEAVLPGGATVKEFLDERLYKRGRRPA